MDFSLRAKMRMKLDEPRILFFMEKKNVAEYLFLRPDTQLSMQMLNLRWSFYGKKTLLSIFVSIPDTQLSMPNDVIYETKAIRHRRFIQAILEFNKTDRRKSRQEIFQCPSRFIFYVTVTHLFLPIKCEFYAGLIHFVK